MVLNHSQNSLGTFMTILVNSKPLFRLAVTPCVVAIGMYYGLWLGLLFTLITGGFGILLFPFIVPLSGAYLTYRLNRTLPIVQIHPKLSMFVIWVGTSVIYYLFFFQFLHLSHEIPRIITAGQVLNIIILVLFYLHLLLGWFVWPFWPWLTKKYHPKLKKWRDLATEPMEGTGNDHQTLLSLLRSKEMTTDQSKNEGLQSPADYRHKWLYPDLLTAPTILSNHDLFRGSWRATTANESSILFHRIPPPNDDGTIRFLCVGWIIFMILFIGLSISINLMWSTDQVYDTEEKIVGLIAFATILIPILSSILWYITRPFLFKRRWEPELSLVRTNVGTKAVWRWLNPCTGELRHQLQFADPICHLMYLSYNNKKYGLRSGYAVILLLGNQEFLLFQRQGKESTTKVCAALKDFLSGKETCLPKELVSTGLTLLLPPKNHSDTRTGSNVG